MNTTADRIKELRKIANLSQEELGRRVGLQRAAINKYERGLVTNIPLTVIEKLAQVLDVSPTYIVGWDDTTSNPLSTEVKILQGVKQFYGDDVIDLMESYTELSPLGKRRVQSYVEDMWKIYHKDK
jgi:transcriptional regulator with XRE-family HTH domain